MSKRLLSVGKIGPAKKTPYTMPYKYSQPMKVTYVMALATAIIVAAATLVFFVAIR